MLRCLSAESQRGVGPQGRLELGVGSRALARAVGAGGGVGWGVLQAAHAKGRLRAEVPCVLLPGFTSAKRMNQLSRVL